MADAAETKMVKVEGMIGKPELLDGAHLGDGRVLYKGGVELVPADVADALIKAKQAKRV